jgi:hypothetical protein
MLVCGGVNSGENVGEEKVKKGVGERKGQRGRH